jgi:hypothetical protein
MNTNYFDLTIFRILLIMYMRTIYCLPLSTSLSVQKCSSCYSVSLTIVIGHLFTLIISLTEMSSIYFIIYNKEIFNSLLSNQYSNMNWSCDDVVQWALQYLKVDIRVELEDLLQLFNYWTEYSTIQPAIRLFNYLAIRLFNYSTESSTVRPSDGARKAWPEGSGWVRVLGKHDQPVSGWVRVRGKLEQRGRDEWGWAESLTRGRWDDWGCSETVWRGMESLNSWIVE